MRALTLRSSRFAEPEEITRRFLEALGTRQFESAEGHVTSSFAWFDRTLGSTLAPIESTPSFVPERTWTLPHPGEWVSDEEQEQFFGEHLLEDDWLILSDVRAETGVFTLGVLARRSDHQWKIARVFDPTSYAEAAAELLAWMESPESSG